MELNNQSGSAWAAMFFDCSWISNYGDENERLFVATERALKLTSIRHVDSSSNFKKFMKALYFFDAMLSDVYLQRFVPNADRKVLNKLLTQTATNDIDAYIVQTFGLYLQRKTEIKIHLGWLDDFYKALNDLIVENIEETEEDKNDINLLNVGTIQRFPNLEQITITAHYGYAIVYRFNLLSFLSKIEECSASIKYVICDGDKWMKDSVTASIQKEFNEKGWKITQKDSKTWNVYHI